MKSIWVFTIHTYINLLGTLFIIIHKMYIVLIVIIFNMVLITANFERPQIAGMSREIH